MRARRSPDRVPPSDVSDSFLLNRSPRPVAGPEPALEPRFSTASTGETSLTAVNPADENRGRNRNIRPLPLPLGLIASLALHLSPLLLLLSWTTAPAEIPPPIPVQLVIETPPPPPPAAREAQKPPRRGPLASEDMGTPEAKRTEAPATPDPPPDPPDPAEVQTAMVAPPPRAGAAARTAAAPGRSRSRHRNPPAPATAWRRLDAPHPAAPPGRPQRATSTRLPVSLTRRHLDMLPRWSVCGAATFDDPCSTTAPWHASASRAWLPTSTSGSSAWSPRSGAFRLCRNRAPRWSCGCACN